ncbi:MAG: hypothetical protein L0Y72_24460 [Gemmataceae bacterium]|nr:hypothetical protein [Gemmataceae bacterium]MCI0742199.1 hypothetical protein [Gemmataceae bacterium]
MGLTIHYQLKTSLTKAADIHKLVAELRQFAQDLPFQEVEELVEFRGKEASFDDSSPNDPHRWLKVQAGRYVDEGEFSYQVEPTHIIAFSAYPGEGCEQANFGFCTYPDSIAMPSTRRRLPTNLTGWSWRSFCKTQYASCPDFGGVENFLRCHVTVIKLLDFAAKSGLIQVEVQDEGDYWQKRDLAELAREVCQWNENIAAMSGVFKDAAEAMGVKLESAIAGFANFEHLEAKGLERLRQKGLMP